MGEDRVYRPAGTFSKTARAAREAGGKATITAQGVITIHASTTIGDVSKTYGRGEIPPTTTEEFKKTIIREAEKRVTEEEPTLKPIREIPKDETPSEKAAREMREEMAVRESLRGERYKEYRAAIERKEIPTPILKVGEEVPKPTPIYKKIPEKVVEVAKVAWGERLPEEARVRYRTAAITGAIGFGVGAITPIVAPLVHPAVRVLGYIGTGIMGAGITAVAVREPKRIPELAGYVAAGVAGYGMGATAITPLLKLKPTDVKTIARAKEIARIQEKRLYEVKAMAEVTAKRALGKPVKQLTIIKGIVGAKPLKLQYTFVKGKFVLSKLYILKKGKYVPVKLKDIPVTVSKGIVKTIDTTKYAEVVAAKPPKAIITEKGFRLLKAKGEEMWIGKGEVYLKTLEKGVPTRTILFTKGLPEQVTDFVTGITTIKKVVVKPTIIEKTILGISEIALKALETKPIKIIPTPLIPPITFIKEISPKRMAKIVGKKDILGVAVEVEKGQYPPRIYLKKGLPKPLKEEVLTHELLHVRFPKLTEKEIVAKMKILELLKIKPTITKIISKPIEKAIIKTKLITIPKAITIIKTKEELARAYVAKAKVKVITKEEEALKSLIGISVAQITKAKIREAQLLKLKVGLITKPILEQKPIPTPTPIGSTLLPEPKIFLPKIKLLKKVAARIRAYQLFVKRFGIFKPVGVPMPKAKAIVLGAKITRETLAAQFKLKPTKEFIKGIEGFAVPSPRVFRAYRILKGKKIPMELAWIERKEFRLAEPTEVAEIQRARRTSLLGFKSKKRKKIKSIFGFKGGGFV